MVQDASFDLPIASMVRAICQAAEAGPDLLYEVLLKLTLMVDSTAQTYGLSIWTQKPAERPQLHWVEGLDQNEIEEAEAVIADALSVENRPSVRPGDQSICMVLSLAAREREGAAIYGRFARPLTDRQAAELRILADVAELAHSRASIAYHSKGGRPPVSQSTLPSMVFTSRLMLSVATAVERIKDSDSTVLIHGESGTGKELVARAIHRLSRRSQNHFIPFNCTAAPADLIESMLFGHRKGSFTGAHTDYIGLIRSAEGGTLFLDEIGDLPLALQPKLLRFLQEGEIQTLGETSPRKVNVRVVVAAHNDLETEVRKGRFREDLFYRVATLSIHVPPLRDRPEDIAVLISHFLSHFARRNDHAIGGITSEAIMALQNYDWPGNVRELAAEMERLVLYAAEGAYITIDDLGPKVLPANRRTAIAGGNLDGLLEDFERRVITEALKRHDCNVAKASEALGLGSRQTLYKKLKRLAIDVGESLREEAEPALQQRAGTR